MLFNGNDTEFIASLNQTLDPKPGDVWGVTEIEFMRVVVLNVYENNIYRIMVLSNRTWFAEKHDLVYRGASGNEYVAHTHEVAGVHKKFLMGKFGEVPADVLAELRAADAQKLKTPVVGHYGDGVMNEFMDDYLEWSEGLRDKLRAMNFESMDM